MTRAADLAKLIAGGGTITVADNSDTLTLESTDADANVGPVLNLHRNSASPADGDLTGRIVFKADDDAGNAATFARIEATAVDVSNGGEDGRLDFFTAKDDAFNAAVSILGTDVGIGTTSPTDTGGFGKALDVSSSTGAAVYVRDSGGSKTGHFGQFNEQTSIVSRQDDGNIAFYVGASPSERMKIDNTGDVTITDGDLVIGTSGHGIDFSSTSDAGGMANELLDDYEEGTWTPSFGGSSGDPTVSSYGVANGKYTKVGNKVYANFVCIASGTPSGGSGDLLIAGLPFSLNATNTQATGYLGIVNNITNDMSASQLMLVGQSTGTNINVMNCSGTSTTATNNLSVDKCHNSGARIDGTFIYTVTA